MYEKGVSNVYKKKKNRDVHVSLHRYGMHWYKYLTKKLIKILGDIMIKKNNVISIIIEFVNFNFLQLVHNPASRDMEDDSINIYEVMTRFQNVYLVKADFSGKFFNTASSLCSSKRSSKLLLVWPT